MMDVDHMEYITGLSFAMFVGLLISFAFRRKQWVPLVWLPCALLFVWCSLGLLAKVVGIFGLSGPDSGFGVFGLFVYLPLLGLYVSGLVACYFCRPIESGWNPLSLSLALVFSTTAAVIWKQNNVADIEVRISDIHGRPLSGLHLSYNDLAGAKIDSSMVRFKLKRHESTGLIITPTAYSSLDNESPLTNSKLAFVSSENLPGKLKVVHSWSHRVGFDDKLSESFTEVIPFQRKIKTTFVIPPDGSFDPSFRKKRIRAAFMAVQESSPQILGYNSVCRNLEAVEFIAELIEIYRRNKDQDFSVIQGLKPIAENLANLDKACIALQKKLQHQSYPPRIIPKEQIEQLGIWAEIPPNSAMSDFEKLQIVRGRIATLAEPLIHFSIDGPPQDTSRLVILEELRQLGRPVIPQLIAALLANPPRDMRSAVQWRGVFFSLRASVNELKPLRASGNTLLETAASDAVSE